MKAIKSMAAAAVLLTLNGCGGSDSPIVNPPAEPPSKTLSIEVVSQALEGQVIKQLWPLVTTQSTANTPNYVATTERGVYLRHGDTWSLSTPDNWNVWNFIAVNEQNWLVSYRVDGISYLARSQDNGQSWENLPNNFGSVAQMSRQTQEPIYRMTTDTSGDRIFGVGTQVLAESLDGGQTWQAISGFWGSFGTGLSSLLFVDANPEQDAVKTLFYGGQGPIENPLLFRFDITEANEGTYSVGAETQIDVSAADLLPVPAVVEQVIKLPSGDGHFLATGEGGFIKTEDNGASWESLSGDKNYRFYFDVLIHPDDSNFWVTAGWEKNFDTHQPLIIEASRDAGETWQSVTWTGANQEGVFGGTWSMKWANPDENSVYIGTYKGGIYKIEIDF